MELNEVRNTLEASNSSFTCLAHIGSNWAVCGPQCSQFDILCVTLKCTFTSMHYIWNPTFEYITGKNVTLKRCRPGPKSTIIRVFMTRCCDRVFINQRKSSVYPPVVFCGLSPRLSWSVCFFFWRLSCCCCLSILVFYLHISINISLDLMLRVNSY